MHSLRRDANRHRVVGLITTTAGTGLIAGAILPWLTVYHGLTSFSGISGLNGRLVAGAGAAAVVLGVWEWTRPQHRLQYSIGAFGFVLALFCAYLMAQLLDLYHGLQGVYLPALGPGLPLAAASSLAIIATLFVRVDTPDHDSALAHLEPGAALLIALSAGAGTIHLAVAAEHFREFPLYGVFFAVAGIAQLGWAVLIAVRGVSRPLLLLAVANLLIALLWVASRTTGVPIGPNPWVPESVGLADVVSTGFELILVGLAVWFLVRRRLGTNRVAKAGWVLPAMVGVATILVVIIDVSAHRASSL